MSIVFEGTTQSGRSASAIESRRPEGSRLERSSRELRAGVQRQRERAGQAAHRQRLSASQAWSPTIGRQSSTTGDGFPGDRAPAHGCGCFRTPCRRELPIGHSWRRCRHSAGRRTDGHTAVAKSAPSIRRSAEVAPWSDRHFSSCCQERQARAICSGVKATHSRSLLLHLRLDGVASGGPELRGDLDSLPGARGIDATGIRGPRLLPAVCVRAWLRCRVSIRVGRSDGTQVSIETVDAPSAERLAAGCPALDERCGRIGIHETLTY
jgi:hypothetical protein